MTTDVVNASSTRREAAAARTVFVDWTDLETRLTQRQAQALSANSAAQPARKRRVITTVDEEVKHVRRNVQDSAQAVLTWLSAVLDHREEVNLNNVLNRCLRPGPDVTAVNFAALAQEISQTMGVDISAKRVQNAVHHLRRAQDLRHQRTQAMQRESVRQKLDQLHEHLRANYEAILSTSGPESGKPRREVGVQVLAALRRAASRLIENDFGEGIPQAVDLDSLEGRFLDFVRGVARQQALDPARSNVAADLQRLLIVLGEYDGSTESDMRMVVDGARVVAELLGPASLAGLLAQLNVLVAGRHLLDSRVYCEQMFRLADATLALHDDADTASFMNWVHRLPEETRVPSPLRVASYALNNAATHVLERLFLGDWADAADEWLARARAALQRMKQRDSGFRLVKTTEALLLTVEAKVHGDAQPIHSLFQALGPQAALELVRDVTRFDNCQPLVKAVRQHAQTVWPQLEFQLLAID